MSLLRGPLLVVLGVLLGVWGAFLVPAGPRVDGQVLSLGAALAIVVNPLAVRLGLRAVPRWGGFLLLAGWTVVAVLLSIRTSGGSVVLPGSGDLAGVALAYIVGGLVTGAVAATVRTRV